MTKQNNEHSNNSDQPELEKAAQTLSAHQDFRVVRRYKKPKGYASPPADSAELKTGIYIDVETTGLDYRTDHIIELAMVKFEFSSNGQLYELGEEFDQLRDPGVPIPEIITKITGINDQMVRGKTIDEKAVNEFIGDAALLVAHNAGFDRKFVESMYDGFADKAWACSARDVNWHEAGFESAKLEYLAYRQGFFYDGHRAVTDCLAGIQVLSYPIDAGHTPAFAALLTSARRKEYRLWAANSPFESKDVLKARGYRWNAGDDGRPKAWYKDLPENELKNEQDFLASKIYGSPRELPMDVINAFNRYSTRI